MISKYIIRWLCGCLFFSNTSCRHNEQAQAFQKNIGNEKVENISSEKLKNKLDSIKKLIEAGDIVTRTGNDFTSQSLKTLNRKDKTFSHCGIANIENDSLVIYHAIGGEWNPDEKIKRDSFEAYTNPYDNNFVGIYRFTLLKKTKENLLKIVQHSYSSNILFDLDFDLKTNDKMYCSEFVYKSITKACSNNIIFNHSYINNFEFVGVDDITEHKLSQKIALVDYKKY